MHNIEPYYNWLHLYNAAEDNNSPFYLKDYSEFYYTDKIYNHLIHPQWDNFGSETLFLKMLYVSYDMGFAIIELIGEWNDCISSDISIFYNKIIEPLVDLNIDKLIIIGENILNFFGDSDEYYAEWEQANDKGWVVLLNFEEHVKSEMSEYSIDEFWLWGGALDNMDWRKFQPIDLFLNVSSIISKRLPY